MIGQTISHYKIVDKIGAGGMGEVYKAEDTRLGRTVALKFLPRDRFQDPQLKARFLQEARAASSLDHGNICTIHECDEAENGRLFIAMAYYDGETLKDKIRHGPLSLPEAADIALQTAVGLQKAHHTGIVHRDIKPANIFITSDGQVKILDFGLAKQRGDITLTRNGTTMGTIAYMSPEQARGEQVDYRTDIWSLGVVFYEMLTGKLPFKGDNEQAMIYSILNENPSPIKKGAADIPAEVENCLFKMLKKNPKERWAQCSDILAGLQEMMNSTQKDEGKTRQKDDVHKKKKSTFLLLGLAFAVISIILITIIFILNQRETFDSIAILPFQNSSQDPNLEFLSREIPASLINNLTRLPDLRVVPRTTVFRYAGHESDLYALREDLKVTSVLTGEINVIGENLFIRAELINLKNDSQIWGDRFEKKFIDLFEIEEEITTEISGALKLHLTGEDKLKLVKRYTEDIEAYRAYMEGRFWWNKRSPEGFSKAEQMFNRAIQIDPNYALAYAGLAECYCMLSINLAKPESVIRRGRIAAERALSIDETLAQAHAALGWIKFAYDWDWLGAERSFKQAIQLNPQYATAYNWYAVLLSFTDRHEEGVRLMTKAKELDPGSAIINRDLGIVLAWAGDYEKAVKQLQLTINLDPDFSPAYFLMGVVYIYKKEYDSAIEYFKKVREVTGDFHNTIGSLCFSYARSGQTEAALSELKRLKTLSEGKNSKASDFCISHAGLGNIDKAFEWLDLACKNHEFAVLVMLGCELEIWFEEMTDDPRLKELLKRVGLEK